MAYICGKPAVTDWNIFHLPANTQDLPTVGQLSPKKPDKIEKGLPGEAAPFACLQCTRKVFSTGLLMERFSE